ncbi:tetratricopeptide repeat protein [Marinicrinis sediminis]|uniref:Tetratricopeptide repeat protein n=1 Tax=Marinicrinis sediminis TaxID=1652465 RepID=A0ABW5R6S0_9BACL
MKQFFSIFLKIVIPAILIIAIFQFHVLAGIGALAVYVGIAIIRLRVRWYALRGNVAYANGNVKAAQELLDKAARTGKADAKILNGYGYLLLTQGQVEAAEEWVLQALEKSESRQDQMNSKINLSLVLWLKGEQGRAILQLRELNKEMKNTIIYGNLGYFLVLRGYLEEALEYNLEAYTFNGESKTILDNLGQTYYLMGDMEKAQEIYRKLIPMKPTIAEPYYYYACTLEQLDETEEAILQLERALEYEVSLISSIQKSMIEQKLEALRARATVQLDKQASEEEDGFVQTES